MTRIGTLVFATAVIFVASSNALAKETTWFVSLEGGIGRANQTWETEAGDLEFSHLKVVRQSIALGLRYRDHVSAAVEVSLVERGAQDQVHSVFRPEGGQRLFYERSYVDVALPLSYRIRFSESYVTVGGAPRMSVLAEARTPFPTTEYPRTLVVGIDPYVRVGYRWLYATGRYVVDLVRPYARPSQSPKITIRDEVFFLGIGIEIIPQGSR